MSSGDLNGDVIETRAGFKFREIESAADNIKLARAFRRRGDTAMAERVLRAGLDRYGTPLHLREYAEIASLNKNWNEAVQRWRVVVESKAGEAWPRAHLKLAQALRTIGALEEGELVISASMDRFQNDVTLFREHALIAEARNEWTKARERWQIVLERFSEAATAGTYLKLARALRRLGERQDEESILTAAIAKFPGDLSLRIQYAELAAVRDCWRDAAERWQAVIECDQNGPVPVCSYRKLGQALWRAGQREEAYEPLRSAGLLPSFRHERRFSLGKNRFILRIAPVYVQGATARFLCHRSHDYDELVLAVHKSGLVYISYDMGLTWTAVTSHPEKRYLFGFLTESCRLLLWSQSDRSIDVYDTLGNMLGTNAAPYPWHGSWGIGQQGATIMYGEYATESSPVHRVWRSRDDGLTWETVLVKRTNLSSEPEIRHFHTVQPDPYHPEHWYVSSGDAASHSRIWMTKDDGDTWIEVTDPIPIGTRTQSVHRFTALSFTPNHLYWGTDDFLGTGCAHYVEAKRGEPLSVSLVGTLGRDKVRTITQTGVGHVCLSQAKKGPSPSVYIDIVSDEGEIVSLEPIKSSSGRPSAFTQSCAVKKSRDGRFLTASRKNVLGDPAEMYLWDLKREEDLDLSDRCNICSDEIYRLILARDDRRLSMLPDVARWSALRRDKWESECPTCRSSIRNRGLQALAVKLSDKTAADQCALIVSGTRREYEILGAMFPSVRNVSLYAAQAYHNCEGGIDITSMPSIESNRFDVFVAICVLDFVESIDAALDEIKRVLKPGGKCLFYIMPYRLRNDSEPPTLINKNALNRRRKSPRQVDGTTGIPQHCYGIYWLTREMSARSFEIEVVDYFDCFSRTHFPWFFARKSELI